MSTVEHPRTSPVSGGRSPLVEGERLDRPTFHERYVAMPPGCRAELIGGIVSMPSPLSVAHSDSELLLAMWLDRYAEATPGVHLLLGATVLLDDAGEPPQPDLHLRIRPECGGQTRDVGEFVAGAPELVVEVAHTTRDLDLGPKLDDYDRAGVLEYVVHASKPDELIWHARRDGRLARVPPDDDGTHRSAVFPGLWLDPTALLGGDRARVRATLDLGLATPEHAAFATRLAARAGA